MTATKRKRLLALVDGMTTAQNLQRIAAANGIVTTVEYCRRVLKLAGRFRPAEPGRRIKHTAVYDLIKQADTLPKARELVEQFGLSRSVAQKIISAAKPPEQRRGYGKPPLREFAKQLELPATAKQFAETHGCSLVQAYAVLRQCGKLIRVGRKIRPGVIKRTSKPQTKRIAAPAESKQTQQIVVRKVETRPIAKMFEDWARRKL